MAVYYFKREDLEDALGKQTVTAIFDEDNSGQSAERAIDACRAYGTSECNSFLRTTHSEDSLPATEADVPDELKFAALDFGCAYAMRRRPELVRAMNEESWTTFRDSALEKMKRYQATLQRLPRDVSVPANVGGAVVRTTSEASAEDAPTRRWDNMGDF